MLTTSAIVAAQAIQDASSADTEKPPAMSAMSRSTSCEEIVEPICATAIAPIVVIATESGGWAVSVCAALAPEARSLISVPSSGDRETEEGEQEQPADNRDMFQAGRQFVSEFRSAARPEAVPEQRCRNRKAGEQQRAKPCEQSRGNEASADELGKDRGAGESCRPREPIAPDLLNTRAPMPKLIHGAVEKHGGQEQPGDREPVLNHASLIRAAIRNRVRMRSSCSQAHPRRISNR
jgi:hypothetical protein